MTGRFHFEVAVPVPIVAAGFEFPPVPAWSPSYSHARPSPEMLSEEFLDWLESKHMKPRRWCNPLVFYAHPNSKTVVHTDLGFENMWAMNCVLGEGEVAMHWHAPTADGEQRSDDLQYLRFVDDAPIIESAVITPHKLTISNIGVPHSSSNFGPGNWVLSLRMAPVDLRWPFLKGLLT